MDWKLLATTFVTVFFAELGDKTQLATLSFASSSASKWAVFIGSAAALVLCSAIAVLLGETASKLLSAVLLKRIAAAAFVVIGLWMFWKG